MTFPDFQIEDQNLQWDRFKELLWFDENLDIWLDVSRMKLTSSDLNNLSQQFISAFESIQELESGSIANRDENRQVGHYWLRNPDISPSNDIKQLIYRLRTSMISVKENFGTMFGDTTCDLCEQNLPQTQLHLLSCSAIVDSCLELQS